LRTTSDFAEIARIRFVEQVFRAEVNRLGSQLLGKLRDLMLCNFRRIGVALILEGLGDRARSRDPSNLVRTIFGKPKRPARAAGDKNRNAIGGWGREFGDGASGSDAANPAGSRLWKPKGVVRQLAIS
jgi:hypothetical protein